MDELLVTYPGGGTVERTSVVAVTPVGDSVLFALERTPCHPESTRWPDQPADRCALEVGDGRREIECFEGSLRDGELAIGEPPQGEPSEDGEEVIRCVVHRAPANTPIAVGTSVRVSVDEGYRESLSRSHSRCHIVSLALNAALAEAWRKEPEAHDSLGNPDFDRLAIQSSTIRPERSIDVYRIGRHLRKSGFSAQALEDPEALGRRVVEIARSWVDGGVAGAVSPAVCRLDDRRTWSCDLPAGVASFPCGGTHAARIDFGDGLRVEIAWEPAELRLTMVAS